VATDRAEHRGNAPKPRVLWVSESPRLHTGFGRVADEITRRLAASGRFELGVLGWSMEPPQNGPGDYTLFSPGAEPWSSTRVNRVIDDFCPDVVVTSGPLFALRSMVDVPLREFVSWVGYASLEAAPLSADMQVLLREMDQVVVPSAWCRSAIAEEPRAEGQPMPATQVIYHGVDTQVFRPRPDRQVLRAALGLEDRFVIGCVAKNDFRKQIPILIKAFALFVERHPDAFLYLHTDPDGPAWRLPELVKLYRLERQVAFTQGLAGPVGVTSWALNVVYNLFDVMALPTMGEAFGLPILEAMAAGVPVIATACSAVTELVEGRGELIAVRDWLTMHWDNAEYALADAGDLVEKLERLYSDRDLRMEYARNGRGFAETMTWDHTADAWMRLLDEVAPRTAPGHREALTPWLNGRGRGHLRLQQASQRRDGTMEVSRAGRRAGDMFPSEVESGGDKRITPSVYCTWPWFKVHISVSGDVYPCCFRMGRCGSLAEEPALTIWQSSMADLRRALRQGQEGTPCSHCFIPARLRATNPASVVASDDNLPLPRSVELDLSTRCDGRCRFCTTTLGAGGQDMSWEVLEAALPLIGPGCDAILFGWGEGLLHERFLEIVSLVKRRGAMTYCSTNGMPSAAIGAGKLRDAGLDHLVFSFGAVDPALHELAQPGVRSEVVWRSLADCSQMGILTVALLVVMRSNIAEIPAFVDKAAAHGARQVILQEMLVPGGPMVPEMVGGSVFAAEQLRLMLRKAEELTAAFGMTLESRLDSLEVPRGSGS